ncbi:MAG: leucine-rich repeat protein [Muribaculaceae bacterium]|nr:leucine-rich repeat protein [Muribaculaceae bacterium]
MMKRFFFLAIVLIACSLVAEAIDFEMNNLRYSVNSDNTSVTVTTPAEGKTYSGDITIPGSVANNGVTYSVTAIGEYAFEDCTELTSVVMPNSVTSIGEYAFDYCLKLKSVVMPNSVTSIGNGAFHYCSALTSVSLPENLTSIGNMCFQWCFKLKDVDIPASVTKIGDAAFDGCSLTKVVIPNSVTEIGDYSFRSCDKLTDVTIGNSVTTIGDAAFQNCSNLPRVTIPKSVTYLDVYAFSDCNSLKSLTWNAKECIIGSNWLQNVQLTELIIGDEVERIPAYWMENQSSLTSLVIPASVTWICENAFEDCYGLTRIDAYPDPTKVTMGKNVFTYVEKDGTLHVLPQYLSAYQTANQWRDFTNIKGDLSEFVKGDVNKDKEVSIADVTTLVNILMANESPIAATDFPTADVNEDGEVGIADVTSLVNILLAE